MTKSTVRRLASASAFTCALVISACGGGSNAGTAPTLGAVTSTNSSHATALVHLTFIVPKKTASSTARAAKYVSTATQSLSITVTPVGGTAQSPIDVACTTTCAAEFQAPVGSDSIALELTDGPNGTGNQLSLSTTTVSVAANAANTFNLTANPVVSSVAILLGAVPAATVSTNGGTAADVPVTVNAMDADGNIIVGPGNFVDVHGSPVTLTLSVTNAQAGGNGTVSLNGTTTMNAPGGTRTAHYDGNWLDHSTISINGPAAIIAQSGAGTSATLTSVGAATVYTAGFFPGILTSGLTVGPDGAIWATYLGGGNGDGAIFKFDSSGVLTGYFQTFFLNLPWDIALGHDGNLWFTNFRPGGIGRVDPQGNITLFTAGMTDTRAFDIVAGPDGNMWFTEFANSVIGRITPSGAITEFSAGMSAGAQPLGITVGPDGALWFSDQNNSQIDRITTSGTINVVATTPSAPQYITAGPDGNIWYSSYVGNAIGRVTAGGAVTEYSTNAIAPGGGPRRIITGPDGALWVDFTNAQGLARISTTGGLTLYTTGFNANATSSGGTLTVGPDHNIWVGNPNGVTRFTL